MGEFEIDVERVPTILERTPYRRAMLADAAVNAAHHGYHDPRHPSAITLNVSGRGSDG